MNDVNDGALENFFTRLSHFYRRPNSWTIYSDCFARNYTCVILFIISFFSHSRINSHFVVLASVSPGFLRHYHMTECNWLKIEKKKTRKKRYNRTTWTYSWIEEEKTKKKKTVSKRSVFTFGIQWMYLFRFHIILLMCMELWDVVLCTHCSQCKHPMHKLSKKQEKSNLQHLGTPYKIHYYISLSPHLSRNMLFAITETGVCWWCLMFRLFDRRRVDSVFGFCLKSEISNEA